MKIDIRNKYEADYNKNIDKIIELYNQNKSQAYTSKTFGVLKR
ncbi:hypothetical protein [Pseudostreptobacillus hongkongensis]|nr:hypothetical protein [Pseudostreptobacillus hongkongensis]